MLRITEVQRADGERCFRVEGRLSAEYAVELARVAGAALAASTVRLNLADVTFVDHAGATILRSLRASGAKLDRPSEFVLAMMNGGQP